MALYRIRPNGDIARNSVELNPYGSASASAIVSDDNDGSYVQYKGGTTTPVEAFITVSLSDLPNLGVEKVVQVQVVLRLSTGFGTTSTFVRLQDSAGNKSAADYWAVSSDIKTNVYGQWHRTAPDGGEWTAAKVNDLLVDVRDDQAGVTLPALYEVYVDVQTNNPPYSSPTEPDGTITTTMQPTVIAGYSDTEGDPQASYELRVFNDDQYLSPFFNPEKTTPVWTTGELPANTVGINHTIDSPLPNDVYRVYVRVRQGGSFPLWSSWMAKYFTIDVTPPNSPSIAAIEPQTASARIRLHVTDQGPTPVDGETRKFEVERSVDGGATFSNAQTFDDDLDAFTYTVSNTSREAYDYFAPRGSIIYRVRVVATLSGGEVIASDWTTSSAVTLPASSWWLKSTTDPTKNITINVHSTDFSATSNEAQGVFRALGRSKPLVLSDTVGGETGDLVLAFLDQTSYDAFEELRSRRETLLLQSPYGHDLYVHLGADCSASFMLNSGGTPKRVVTVPFIEVEP